MLAEETEKRVVERAKNGDRTAIKQIYDCYARYLAATCSRFLPDPTDQRDVLQDSFVKIFTSLDKFDFKGEGSLARRRSRMSGMSRGRSSRIS